jgi:hypothetical protein
MCIIVLKMNGVGSKLFGRPCARSYDGVVRMLELAPGWTMELDRGPNWLIVRLHDPPAGAAADVDLSQQLWDLLQKHFTNRLVLELDELPTLGQAVIDQLARLRRQIIERGGQLRLCGLSEESVEALRAGHPENSLPRYRDRTEAVMGYRPNRPR